MSPWKPKPRGGVDWSALRLTPQEAYVLSRLDGATDTEQLAQLSGLAPEDLGNVLTRLVSEGVLEGAPPAALPRANPPPPEVDAGPLAALLEPEPAAEEATPAADDSRDGAPAPSGPGDAAHATHRELFERTLHALEVDARAAMAATALEPQLSALCFDPVSAVVTKVLENPHAGLTHARLIAAWHANPVGLEALGRRGDLFRDGEVQRLLLRNNQTPTHLVRQMLGLRRLHDVYNVAQSHEAGERHRATAREVLRTRFAKASPEERVELILTTEGRCLATLSGLSLDGKAAALLCARTLASTLLLENLARWPATPPNLVAHLLQQPLVRRMPNLQAALKRHPNCPSHAK
jgi:hypothetical protein